MAKQGYDAAKRALEIAEMHERALTRQRKEAQKAYIRLVEAPLRLKEARQVRETKAQRMRVTVQETQASLKTVGHGMDSSLKGQFSQALTHELTKTQGDYEGLSDRLN